jgi:hypothetical protein
MKMLDDSHQHGNGESSQTAQKMALAGEKMAYKEGQRILTE